MTLDNPILIQAALISFFIFIIVTTPSSTANAQIALPGKTSSSKILSSHGFKNNDEFIDRKFSTYQNSAYGIKIQYPSGWIYKGRNNSVTKDKTLPPTVLFTPIRSALHDVSNASIGFQIKVQDLSISNTSPLNNLSLIAEIYLSRASQVEPEDFQQLLNESNPHITLAGNNSGYKTTFVSSGIKNMVILTKYNNRLYYINSYAPSFEYSKYLPTIQRMINSFEITGTGEVFTTYEDPTYGIKFQYPSNWEEEPKDIAKPNIVKFHSPPALNSSLVILAGVELPKSITLAKYTQDAISMFGHNQTGFNLVSSNTSSIVSTIPASTIIFTAKDPESDTDILCHVILAIKDNKEFAIIYTTNAEHIDSRALPSTLQKIIDSFEIK